MSLFKNLSPNGGTDWRGIIAVLVLACTFGLTAIQIFRGVPVEEAVPQWATTLVGIIATFYYVSKGHEESGNGHETEAYRRGRLESEAREDSHNLVLYREGRSDAEARGDLAAEQLADAERGNPTPDVMPPSDQPQPDRHP